MATYPEPLKTWNSIVKSTLKKKLMQVASISPNQLVDQVEKNKEYHLYLTIENTSNVELVYEHITVRLVGRADQVDFISPAGAIDYNGQPRVHLASGHVASGEERTWTIRFKARKTMSIKSLKFNTGIYGQIQPLGHYWTTLSPSF